MRGNQKVFKKDFVLKNMKRKIFWILFFFLIIGLAFSFASLYSSVLLYKKFNVRSLSAYASEGDISLSIEVTTAVTPSPAPAAGGGGGGGVTKIASLSINTPGSFTLDRNDIITIPMTIINTGEVEFRGITLSTKSSNPSLVLTLDTIEIVILKLTEVVHLNLIVESQGSNEGEFEITVNLESRSPKFTESATIFFNVIDSFKEAKEGLYRRIKFAQDLFRQNPACLEFNTFLIRAEELTELGRFDEASTLIEEAIRLCKDEVTARLAPLDEDRIDLPFIVYPVLITLILIIIVIIIIVILERRKRKKKYEAKYGGMKKKKKFFGPNRKRINVKKDIFGE